MVIDVNIRTALRVGGFILVVLSVLSILISLMWHQYKHFINYVSAGDIIFLLAQSCMVVGGLLMICIPKPKTALQIGGIALEALSVFSVLAGLRYHQYSFLTTSGSLIATGETIATGLIGLILVQGCMAVMGIVLIYISKEKGRQ